MNKFFIILFTLVFTLLALNLQAQQRVYEKDVPCSFTFRYLTSNEQLPQNYFINSIAAQLQKSSLVTTYTLNGTIKYSIWQIDSVTYNCVAELKEITFSGDITYKGIRIDELLMPDRADYTLKISGKTNYGLEKVREKVFSDIQLTENLGYLNLLKEQFNDSLRSETITISINDLEFGYSQQAHEKFSRFIGLIDEYYSASEKIKILLKKIIDIDSEDIEKVAFNTVVVNEVSKEFQFIQDKNFPLNLHLWKADPLEFIPRIEEFQSLLNSTRYLLGVKYEKLDSLYFQRGLQYAHNSKPDSASFYFNKSIQFNPQYIPALTELANIEFQKENFPEAISTLSKIYSISEVSNIYKERLSLVTETIITTGYGRIERIIEKQDFVLAISELELYLNLCLNVQTLNCSEDVQKYMTKAKYGLYKSYLTVAEKAIENGKHEVALIYIKSAIDYQQENSSYILNTLEATANYKLIYQSCYREIEKLLSTKNTEKAYDLFQWLEVFCRDYSDANCSEIETLRKKVIEISFEKKIKQIESELDKKKYIQADKLFDELSIFIGKNNEITANPSYLKIQKEIFNLRYERLVEEGLTNYKYSFMTQAFENFRSALLIQNQFSISPSKKLLQISDKLAYEETLNLMQYDNKHYKNFTQGDLKQKIAYIDTTLHLFKLENNEELLRMRSEIQKHAEELFCDSLLSIYTNKINLVKHEIKKREYIEADRLIELTLSSFNKISDCTISFKEILDLKESISSFVQIQKVLNESDSLVGVGKYEAALLVLSNAKKMSDGFNISPNENIVPIEIEYIKASKKKEMYFSGFEYFFSQKRYDEAFQVLQYMQKNKIHAGETIEIQTRLGEKLSIRDKINNPRSNYRINILRYTEGEEYFLYFSNSYKKNWKKHKIGFL